MEQPDLGLRLVTGEGAGYPGGWEEDLDLAYAPIFGLGPPGPMDDRHLFLAPWRGTAMAIAAVGGGEALG